MCSLLLVCAVLKTIHLVKDVLYEEECTSVRKAGDWWKDELAIAIAVKPPSVVQETLSVLVLEEDFWCDIIAALIKSKLFHMTACVSSLMLL